MDEFETKFPGVLKVDVGVEEDQNIALGDFDDGAHDDVADFLDLWLVGMARCVVHGIGGFGSFSAMLARSRCTYFHRRGENRVWMGEHTKRANV